MIRFTFGVRLLRKGILYLYIVFFFLNDDDFIQVVQKKKAQLSTFKFRIDEFHELREGN